MRLANAFGSPNILTTTHICTWNRGYGSKYTYGVSTPTPDYDTSCMLLWGYNPQVSEPAAAMRISQAQARGAKLIVIDPRRNSLAQKAALRSSASRSSGSPENSLEFHSQRGHWCDWHPAPGISATERTVVDIRSLLGGYPAWSGQSAKTNGTRGARHAWEGEDAGLTARSSGFTVLTPITSR